MQDQVRQGLGLRRDSQKDPMLRVPVHEFLVKGLFHCMSVRESLTM